MINGTMCFLKNKGKTLFLYRNEGKKDMHNGFYVPPGGHLERGERSIECIIREFQEETGLIPFYPKLRIIATFYNKDRILGRKKDPEDWRVETYEAEHFAGELKSENPKNKLVWVKNSEIGKINMYEGDKKLFSLLKEPGVFEAILQYDKEKLVRFDSWKVY